MLVNDFGESRLLKLHADSGENEIEVNLMIDLLPYGINSELPIAQLHIDTPQLEQRRILISGSYSRRFFRVSPRLPVCTPERLASPLPYRIRVWRVLGDQRDDSPLRLSIRSSSEHVQIRSWAEVRGGASIELTAREGAPPIDQDLTITLEDSASGLLEDIAVRVRGVS